MSYTMLDCFNIEKNWNKLFDTTQVGNKQLFVFNGIRMFSFFQVIIGKIYYF